MTRFLQKLDVHVSPVPLPNELSICEATPRGSVVDSSGRGTRNPRCYRTCHFITRWSRRKRTSRGTSSLLALTIQRFCSPRKVSLVPASFAVEQRLSLLQTVSTREDLLFINVLRSTAIAIPSILRSIRLQVVHRQTIVRDVLRWLFPRANTPSTTFVSWWATP